MAITTTITTWTRIFKESFEAGYDADPNNDLALSDADREKFLEDCRAHLEAEVDKVLGDIDPTAHILGNGEIIASIEGALRGLDEEGWEDLKERIGGIEFDEICERFAE